MRHYESKVGEAALFDEAFWESLDGVANALDNLEARPNPNPNLNPNPNPNPNPNY